MYLRIYECEGDLKQFDYVLHNNYDHISEPITIFGGEDHGADMYTILQQLEDGEL